ncbi:Subtilase family protein [Janthinobacterium lividum]|uniref:Subtilase family protein n=1 Tax=Janthinobacterium lividum TaxID=29581 RepID=A0AB38C7H6_9BURK|nr:S8 family peptidase [Janthinobacterium lividum]SFX47618.1 Subtilase family protein [Janthinobacterium lividum]
MDEIEKRISLELIYQGCELEQNRFTTDFPITTEVWLLYAEKRLFNRPNSILLTPHIEAGMTGLRSSVTEFIPELDTSSKSNLSMVERFYFASGNAGNATSERYIAANESHLLVHISFYELLALMPLTRWWQQYIASAFKIDESTVNTFKDIYFWFRSDEVRYLLSQLIVESIQNADSLKRFKEIGPRVAQSWTGTDKATHRAALARLINIAALQVTLSMLGRRRYIPNLVDVVKRMLRGVLEVLAFTFPRYRAHFTDKQSRDEHLSPLWQVSCNRPAEHAVVASRKTVKADAAVRVFDTGGKGIRWAVVDSGIDARHPALARPGELRLGVNIQDGQSLPSLSRVVKTLDFTRLVAITSGRVPRKLMQLFVARFGDFEAEMRIQSIRSDLASGRMLDWTAIEPLLAIDQSEYDKYISPSDSHGTHVAGIIGANWQSETYKSLMSPGLQYRRKRVRPVSLEIPPELIRNESIQGVCPEIELLDLRVFTEEGDSDEFAILAALQYIRFLNQSKDRQYVHGVNLSLSLRHDVRNYACGSTPVCLECDRLSGSGVIVVAAAGNFGYDLPYSEINLGGAYRGQSITDPGNAASVITVGATHRTDPYQYGVSYFSSRGPTGDGRSKPDLVAPGEKILSTVLDGTVASMDGTSMAAPHVSGAAALLLSRNNELMGKPTLVKQILCKSASDLGRERAFQGAGLLDTLRALQSV